jgi:hypothetical protein
MHIAHGIINNDVPVLPDTLLMGAVESLQYSMLLANKNKLFL